MVHLHVEDCSEELLRQQSYAIKNQLGNPKPPTRGFGTQIRIVGFNEGKGPIIVALMP